MICSNYYRSALTKWKGSWKYFFCDNIKCLWRFPNTTSNFWQNRTPILLMLNLVKKSVMRNHPGATFVLPPGTSVAPCNLGGRSAWPERRPASACSVSSPRTSCGISGWRLPPACDAWTWPSWRGDFVSTLKNLFCHVVTLNWQQNNTINIYRHAKS